VEVVQDAVCGMGMCEDELDVLDENKGADGKRSLCTKSLLLLFIHTVCTLTRV